MNQWKNTSSAVTWFEKSQTSSMMCFDVENFHPYISSNLSKKSIEFARQSIKIFDDDLSINIQAKKMFLFEGTIP